MKKKVSDFVRSIGGTTKYSGNTKTMYMPSYCHDSVLAEFGFGLPFTLGILSNY